MTLEELSNEELVEEFKQAVENLPGSGARGRSRYYAAEEEVLDRLNQKKALSSRPKQYLAPL